MADYLKILPTLPVQDIERAKGFYREKLGCKVAREDEGPGAELNCSGGELYLYQRGPSKADHTLASFIVDDVESKVQHLRDKGIRFEEYDIPEMHLKTVNGIATMGDIKGAWFKDSEGNILSVTNMPKTERRGEHERTEETVASW